MIYIRKGDDTDFNDSSFLKFELITECDLTGWSASFIIGPVEKVVEDISSKYFEINLSWEETSRLKYGAIQNELKLKDDKGRIKTVVNDLEIFVVDNVVENKHQIINIPVLKEEGIEINVKVSSVEGGGTTKHNELENRNLPNQHTIESITNLREELDIKANKSDVPSLKGYATEDFVNEQIKNISSADLSDYVTNAELENKGYLTEHQDISHLATKKELEAKQDVISDLEEIRENATNAVKDVSNLATKDELGNKQDILTSAVNIKTINNQSILGEGNIEIQGGSSSSINLKDIEPYIDGQWIPNRAYLLGADALAVSQTQVIDVSEIVPQDEYNYEVLLFMYAYPKDAKNGTKCILWMSTDYFGMDNYFLPVRIENPHETTNKLTQGATINVVIGSKREVYITPTAYDTGAVHLGINAYRRLAKAIPNE